MRALQNAYKFFKSLLAYSLYELNKTYKYSISPLSSQLSPAKSPPISTTMGKATPSTKRPRRVLLRQPKRATQPTGMRTGTKDSERIYSIKRSDDKDSDKND